MPAFFPKNKAIEENMDRCMPDKASITPECNINQDEKLKQLEEENLKLRIEVAYLKGLRRLRLEQEAQKRKQGSPTVSEDHSN